MMTMIESAENKKALSAIFVNYRSIFHLSAALRSFQKDPCFRMNTEVIVVNQDRLEKKAMRVLSKQWGFTLIERENRGFASGANAGAAVACGEYLVFLNPDIKHSAGSASMGMDAFRKNTKVGIVGAMLLRERNIPEEWSRGHVISLGRLLRNNVFPKRAQSGRDGVDWVSGGALFIQKELFQSLQGFDEQFFLYFEDMDLCERARKENRSIESLSSLQFLHRGGKSFSSKRTQKKHYFDSQRKYFKKHRPLWEWKMVSIFQQIKIW